MRYFSSAQSRLIRFRFVTPAQTNLNSREPTAIKYRPPCISLPGYAGSNPFSEYIRRRPGCSPLICKLIPTQMFEFQNNRFIQLSRLWEINLSYYNYDPPLPLRQKLHNRNGSRLLSLLVRRAINHTTGAMIKFNSINPN